MYLGHHSDDDALQRAENELKGLINELPAQAKPSQAYWDMFATRTMARVHREEKLHTEPTVWKRLWIPTAATAASAVAVFVFMLTRAVEPTLDATTAQLPADDIQAIRVAEAPIVPVGTMDKEVSAELVTKVAIKHADLDAVLAFSGVEPTQLVAMIHDSPLGSEVYGLDDLNDDDDAALVGMLQKSM